MQLSRLSLYTAALRFPFTGTKGLQISFSIAPVHKAGSVQHM